MPVRTTPRQDGAFRATSQGLGLPAPLGRGRPGRIGPEFARFLHGNTAAAMSPTKSSHHGDAAAVPSELQQGGIGRTGRRFEPPVGPEFERQPERSQQDEGELLDPLCRALAHGVEWRPSETTQPVAEEPIAAAARVSMEQVIDKLVRKIAWSGNSRSGTMRIELGAGALSGATLLVQADGPEVRVTLDLPPGIDAAGWRDRLSQRFSARGLRITELEIR